MNQFDYIGVQRHNRIITAGQGSSAYGSAAVSTPAVSVVAVIALALCSSSVSSVVRLRLSGESAVA